jgi:hypothetical protein
VLCHCVEKEEECHTFTVSAGDDDRDSDDNEAGSIRASSGNKDNSNTLYAINYSRDKSYHMKKDLVSYKS